MKWQLALNSRQQLHAELLCAADPVAVNQQLNDVERELGCDELLSFPISVGLNMTPVCNARCVFCIYQPSMLKEREPRHGQGLAADDVAALRAGTSPFGAASATAWSNPEFLDCYRHLKAAHPHLATTLFDQRHRHDPRSLRRIRGEAWRATGSRSTPRRGRPGRSCCGRRVSTAPAKRFAYLARRRREVGSEKPRLTLSMVLTRANVAEAVEFVELAARLGADATNVRPLPLVDALRPPRSGAGGVGLP